jgi:NTP pyrophosphatase (non-canonical NTP hydrolase)
MEFKEYQENANSLAIYMNKVTEKYPDLPEEILNVLGLSYASLGLGEVGEIQGKVKKVIRDSGASLTDEKREELAKELGDVLWYVAACCKELDISMDYVAEKNLEKLFSRKERGVLEGSGDNR